MTDKHVSNNSTDDNRERSESRLSSSSPNRIDSPKNILNILPNVERRPMNGRVIGTKAPHIPPMVKKIIGETAHLEGRGSQQSIADAFEVDKSSVSRAKEGTGELKEDLDKEIHDIAVNRIAGMFETCLIPENLAKMDPKDATRAMKDLAKVAGEFGGKKGPTFNGPTIVIYTPSEHSEDDYDVIDVEAREVGR